MQAIAADQPSPGSDSSGSLSEGGKVRLTTASIYLIELLLNGVHFDKTSSKTVPVINSVMIASIYVHNILSRCLRFFAFCEVKMILCLQFFYFIFYFI